MTALLTERDVAQQVPPNAPTAAHQIEYFRLAIAQAIHNLGFFARAAGDLALAQQDYEQAASIYDRLGHRREAAQARNNLGGVQFRLGKLEAAEETWQQALAVLEVVGDVETAEQVRHNLTVLAETAAQIESAEEEA